MFHSLLRCLVFLTMMKREEIDLAGGSNSEAATGILGKSTLAAKTGSDLGASSLRRCSRVPFTYRQLAARSSGRVRVCGGGERCKSL